RVGRALDASCHAERAQQVACERGLARAERTLQRDEGVVNGGLVGQRLGEGGAIGLCGPGGRAAFYNRLMGHEVGSGLPAVDGADVLDRLRAWALELGFSQIRVADGGLCDASPGRLAWLEAGFHGSMRYMAAHGMRRARPAELVPGTVRVITAPLDYLPAAPGPP